LARKGLIRQIDRAASIIDEHLFKSYTSTDNSIRSSRDNTAYRISYALRMKEQWITTPKIDTNDWLLGYLSIFLVALLEGCWDNMEAADAPAKSVRTTLSLVLNATRTLLVGFLPAAVFAIVRGSKWFPLSAPLDDYVQVGLVLWGVLALISVFDPHLTEKLSAVKEIIGIFRGEKKA
jgi:hypothetical protein